MQKFREFQIDSKEKNPTFNYRCGLPTYGEGLYDGRLRALGFNGIGYNVRPGMMLDQLGMSDLSLQHAFILDLDGQSLMSHWELADTATYEEEDGILNIRIKLHHTKRPVDVTVCTKMDGSGCFSRWIEVTNLSDKSVALTRLAPMSGALEMTPNWRKLLHKNEKSPYRLGYFENTEHLHEGQFKWHELHSDCYSFGGRYARTRYRHPFFVLENKAKGTAYAVQMAYSGGWKASLDFVCGWGNNATLQFAFEIDGFNPLRVLKAGETIVSPEVIISMANGDMDDAIQQMHEHIRCAVMKKPHGPGCYTETAMGGDYERCFKGVDRAVEKGFDIVYIDAGWYFPNGQNALGWTGHWDPDPERYPNGMKVLADYCHEKGIKFGLWMEPERLGSFAPEWEQDKDKVLNDFYGHHPGNYPRAEGGGYDLARPEVAEYIEAQICKMIEDTGIDMFRLDFNTSYYGPWCYNETEEGWMEGVDFRYNEHFTAMFDRIRNKFPNVIFENCASGGGRTDLGCVKYFDHTWVTDNPVAPRCFAITNGMTMCLPPELVDRLVTTMDAPKMASLDFQLFQLMFTRPTSHFPREMPENPLQVGKFEEFMELYNNFARPMLPTCKMYHPTPSFDDWEPKGVGMLEAVSAEGDKAMLGVFALCDPLEEEKLVRFKGIDASKKYRVTAVAAGDSFVMEGYDLKYKGIYADLKAALTAELFLIEAI